MLCIMRNVFLDPGWRALASDQKPTTCSWVLVGGREAGMTMGARRLRIRPHNVWFISLRPLGSPFRFRGRRYGMQQKHALFFSREE